MPVVLALALAIGACSDRRDPEAANRSEEIKPTVASDSASPLPEPAVDRAQLLVLFLDASSAAIVGADDKSAQQALKGRRFDLRMRFGCDTSAPDPDRSWSYNATTGALKVTVKPNIDRESDERDGLPAKDEAVADAEKAGTPAREIGFLIQAPTVLANGCPMEDFAAIAGFTNLRFGLVQKVEPDEPRARQLLPSYEITKKISEVAVPAQGLDLVIRGRLQLDATGRAIRCAPRGGVIECTANASIEQVAIEDPASKSLIAEWGAR